mmetsp:Transcript_68680/g.121381  ORF Transcript_68680/g.121381 Transcript_68680/m.121381 type:complete len:284 (+) Transcript_68680:1685-2536(+)
MFLPMSCTSPLTVAISTFPANWLSSSSFTPSGSLPSAIIFSRFSSSMKGSKYATAFFMTRALLITWGRNILPDPKRSPTTFIPFMRGPSITSRGLEQPLRASSVSPSMNSEMPLTRACVRRSRTGRSRQEVALVSAAAPPFLRASMSSFSFVVRSSIFSVASGVLLNTRFSQSTLMEDSTSDSASISWQLTMPTSMPELRMAWCRNTAWIDSRITFTPRKPNERLEMPPEILTKGQSSLILLVALMKSTPYEACSSMPVPMVSTFGSKMISSGGNFTSFTRMS